LTEGKKDDCKGRKGEKKPVKAPEEQLSDDHLGGSHISHKEEERGKFTFPRGGKKRRAQNTAGNRRRDSGEARRTPAKTEAEPGRTMKPRRRERQVGSTVETEEGFTARRVNSKGGSA